jgi:hypothetical protein
MLEFGWQTGTIAKTTNGHHYHRNHQRSTGGSWLFLVSYGFLSIHPTWQILAYSVSLVSYTARAGLGYQWPREHKDHLLAMSQQTATSLHPKVY